MKRYLTKEEITTDDPDLVPAGELPKKPDSVDDLWRVSTIRKNDQSHVEWKKGKRLK